MPVRSALINVMIKAAEKAAKGLKRDFGEVERLQVSRKGPADFVSTADMSAQKILREELGKARPSFGFMMEEDDKAADTSGKNERWIVDPLDGTTNFLHGLPHWCISIAAARGKEIIAGVVLDPIKDETFWAEKGLGAYCNNQRMRVSARKDFADCLIATGIPFKGNMKEAPAFTENMNAVMPKVAGIRRLGAAALDMAYVASGRYDAYWENEINAWDVAAGAILVKEAGGFISPFNPKHAIIYEGGIIASNSSIHDEFVKLLRKA
jgi:myo-inositol-1(or 4)-monophosphatase